MRVQLTHFKPPFLPPPTHSPKQSNSMCWWWCWGSDHNVGDMHAVEGRNGLFEGREEAQRVDEVGVWRGYQGHSNTHPHIATPTPSNSHCSGWVLGCSQIHEPSRGHHLNGVGWMRGKGSTEEWWWELCLCLGGCEGEGRRRWWAGGGN